MAFQAHRRSSFLGWFSSPRQTSTSSLPKSACLFTTARTAQTSAQIAFGPALPGKDVKLIFTVALPSNHGTLCVKPLLCSRGARLSISGEKKRADDPNQLGRQYQSNVNAYALLLAVGSAAASVFPLPSTRALTIRLSAPPTLSFF
jgi:hypothetical protein